MNDNITKGELKIARKLREWYPGAIYHMMHRGVRRTEIFSDEADYQHDLINGDIFRQQPI